MLITQKDIKSFEMIKSTNQGTLVLAKLYGGSSVVLLRKENGDLELLATAPSELRSLALANKKYPHLDVPIIVKSTNEDKLKALPQGHDKLETIEQLANKITKGKPIKEKINKLVYHDKKRAEKGNESKSKQSLMKLLLKK